MRGESELGEGESRRKDCGGKVGMERGEGKPGGRGGGIGGRLEGKERGRDLAKGEQYIPCTITSFKHIYMVSSIKVTSGILESTILIDELRLKKFLTCEII